MTGTRTPILVAAGQTVARESSLHGPLQLAIDAAARALDDTRADGLAAAIDTIAFVRLFSDSVPFWASPFGRSTNPPGALAHALGAAPRSLIYSTVGGEQPLSLLRELAGDIARGQRELALICGAEAIRNQRHAERVGARPDWSSTVAAPFEDRGFGEQLATRQEIANGLLLPLTYYTLIEDLQRQREDRTTAQQRAHIASLLSTFSRVAMHNPFAQFPQALEAASILDAAPLTQLYSKRMVAQDGVNQAAALLLTSTGTARRLGIPQERWIYLHGFAQGAEYCLSERADPSATAVGASVAMAALAQAGVGIDSVELMDLYSCFPCAITAIAKPLGLPCDGSRALTVTGGLPFFGGPGNNYALHALAVVMSRLRQQPDQRALVTAIGGMLSKHAAAVLSTQPSQVDWSTRGDPLRPTLPPRTLAASPAEGRLLGRCVHYFGEQPVNAVALAETAAGERFVAGTADDDPRTAQTLVADGCDNATITVAPGNHGKLLFRLAR